MNGVPHPYFKQVPKAEDFINPTPKIQVLDSVQYCGFWTNDFKSHNIQLSTGALRDYLISELGFSILDGQYVQAVNGVVYRRDKNYLYDLIINLVSQQDVTFTANTRSGTITFSVDKATLKTKAQKELRGNVGLIAVPAFDREILRDTASEVYLHFKNCTLMITKDWCEMAARDCDAVVWEDQVIDFEIEENPEGTAIYADFISKIAGNNLNAFRSAIGMLLRNFNGSEGMRAVWLCDESDEVGKANGRTGKGIFWKGISKARKTDDCSGKDFTPVNKFKFQNISRDTQVYVIDDVKQNFDFKAMYNYCTEGAEFEKKHVDRIKLKIQETPQLVITSNYPPHIEEGSSTTGRLFILPLKDFFKKYTEEGGVKGYYKHVFFDEWDKDEWNRFYWFLAECAQYFLLNGLVQSDIKEVRINRLRAIAADKFANDELACDFVDWIYQYDLPKTFQLDSVMKEFGKGNPEEKTFEGAFSACLKEFAKLEGFAFKKDRPRINGKQVSVWVVKS